VVVVLLLMKILHWSREVSAVMLLLVTLGNTSFVGFPMVEALLGEQALPYAIIYDQLGSFVAVSTYGMLVLAYYSGGSISPSLLAKKLLSFPPFIAVIMAAFLIGREYPIWLYEALARIGSSLVPVVMVAVGLQWRLRFDRAYLLPLSLALTLKLLLIPALLWLAMSSLQVTGLAAQTALLESSMPAMITAGALLASHNLAPRLASTIVGYGLLLSLATVPLWSMIIS
jgi:predicted permease